jgi:penicillin-binding protein 1C
MKAAKLCIRLWKWCRRLLLAAVILTALLFVGWLILPKPELHAPEASFSRVVLDRDGRLIHLTLSADGAYRLPAHLDNVAEAMTRATCEFEDRRFFSHIGVDARSLLRSLWGVVSGQRLGGASTLSMQYARLRWKIQTRSVSGKLEQIFRAVQIERHFSKQEILEAYFTRAPYGGNVEGVEAAARLWCGKAASQLTLREAAALAVLPQSPASRSPQRTVRTTAHSAAQTRLMARLQPGTAAMDGDYVLTPHSIPREAPHFSRRALAATIAGTVQTTLDSRQQMAVERSIADFIQQWESRGVTNAAALLLHVPTSETRAYAGSAGFFNVRIEGQVDGVTARRSPGSALKPFIYALALEQGLIHPATLLDDSPQRFGAYNPENSDRGFLGPISAAEALRRSRNLPAVELLSRLDGGGLDGFLRRNGVALARQSGEYGLSLALGGAEVSLEELARIYAGLRRGDSGISRESAWLALDALEQTPGAPAGLAHKTGTSHGFRDAWACGVMGDWVLCVWVGHFNAKPMPGLFARDTAAPLLFQTVQRLGLRGKNSPPPRGLTRVAVCADSGELAGADCPHCKQSWFIAGISPISKCSVHRRSIEDGVVREYWPAHRLEQFRRAGLPRREIVGPAESATPPRIVSPQKSFTYVVRHSGTEQNRIPLEAHAAAGAGRIHWFAGARYLGASKPAQALLWDAKPGEWQLKAVDESGRTASVRFTVAAVD